MMEEAVPFTKLTNLLCLNCAIRRRKKLWNVRFHGSQWTSALMVLQNKWTLFFENLLTQLNISNIYIVQRKHRSVGKTGYMNAVKDGNISKKILKFS